MVLIIDPQTSGIAGNMFIGAFIDLGADANKIKKVIKTYAEEFGNIEININKELRAGVNTTYVSIKTTDTTTRHYKEIITKLDEITKKNYPNNTLINKTIILSKKIFKSIAEAEAHVHGKTINSIHFHEVGLADALADVIGASFAFHLLKLNEEKIYSLPIATGYGTVRTQHGILPVPAPAVAKILENTPTYNGLSNTELATPTGSAILINITDTFCENPPVIINKKIGYGSGSKNLKTLNALRLIKADTIVDIDQITVLETNLDTLTGEVLGSLYDKLLKEGARDVTITPTLMKKNRPGHILKVISKNKDKDHLIQIIAEETGTLGIRILPQVHRALANRENIEKIINIKGSDEKIRFKIGYMNNKIIKYSPEYEDIKKISEKTKIPIKELMEIVNEKKGDLN